MNSRLSFYLIDCLNPTVNTQVGDLKRVPFVRPLREQEEKISSLAKYCIETKKSIEKKYLLNGATTSSLVITNTLLGAIQTVVSEEIEKYVQILLSEWLIDTEINDIYDLNETDRKRLDDKMGICVASIPVYSKALEKIKSMDGWPEDIRDALNKLEHFEIDEIKINEICNKIQNILFTNNNEIEDFCRNNNLNPITVWYFVSQKCILPIIKARNIVIEWVIFAMRDILEESRDGIICISNTDPSIVQVLEEYADKKGITSAQLLQMEEFIGKKIRDFMEKDFFVELMNYTNVFMYLPKTPFIWHLSSGENRGFEAFVSIYKWNADSLYKLKSNYISKRREKLEFRKTQLGDNNTAQILEEKELIDRQMIEIDQFVKKIDELIASGYDPKLDDGVGKNIAPLQKKKMLKADVLNANQLKKYLKAEW